MTGFLALSASRLCRRSFDKAKARKRTCQPLLVGWTEQWLTFLTEEVRKGGFMGCYVGVVFQGFCHGTGQF